MQKKIIEISKNYNLVDILEKTSKRNDKIDLKIGFLGEFSSGKSTLINALLNKKILPSMEKPTSKSVIEIVAKDGLNSIEFYELIDGEKKQISALEFSEIALSDSGRKAMLEVPSNDFFEDGYVMIDTPGISSLDESDTDITYGYLPFLDCAVICNHIQKGSLTQSVINFLLKDEIKPIINNILFVITNGYAKSPKARAKIKKEIISQLIELNKNHNLGMENIRKKVIVVSALEAMNGEENFNLDALKNSFKENFINRKEILTKRKFENELNSIAEQLLDRLIYKREHSTLDLSELKEKELELEEQIYILDKQKDEILNSLEEITPDIEGTISSILNRYLERLKSIRDSKKITSIVEEMKSEIELKVDKIISKHFKELKIDINSKSTQEFLKLENIVHDLLRQIDVGKDIGMVVLIELLSFGSAGVNGIFGLFVRSGSQMILSYEGNNRLKETARLIERVNPMEFIGDKIGEKLIEKRLSSMIEELSKDISLRIEEDLKERVHKEIFDELTNRLKDSKLMLNQIYRDKSDKFDKFNRTMEQLNDDILDLELMQKV